MPVSGFKAGAKVTTPSGRRAMVVSVDRSRGAERVLVELFGSTAYFASGVNRKTFRAAALRPGWPQ